MSISAILLLLCLTASPWLGGQLWLEPQSQDGAPSLAGLLSRSEPAWGQIALASLVFLAVILAAIRRKVLQVPNAKVLAGAFLLWFCLALATIGSNHKHVSLLEFARWTCYLFTMICATMVLGRSHGPRTALIAILVGVSLMALSGIYEFMESARAAPNWRIFAGWQNPNAAAGMFAIALPLCLSLLLTTTERLERILYGLAFCVCACSLWLTASKGGLLAGIIGITTFLLCSLFAEGRRKLLAVPVLVLLASLFVLGVHQLAKASSGDAVSAGGRLVHTVGEAEQSVGFRVRLWKDAAALAREHPITGTGPGTYGIESKRISTTQGSLVAHNGVLQLAAESGVFAAVALVATFLFWLVQVLRRHPAAGYNANIMRYGVAGAVVAAGAGTMVESTFSYFGWSLCVFALLGVGLLLSVDGVAPEKTPVSSRLFGPVVVCVAAMSYMLAGAVSDSQVRLGLESLKRGDVLEGEEHLEKAAEIAPASPSPHYRLAELYGELGRHEAAIQEAERAIQLSPTSQRYGLLAELLSKAGKVKEAEGAYESAIELEPNSPALFRRYFEFLRDSGSAKARDVAYRLVAMETSDAMRIRAIGWLVQTDTISAREFLASQAIRREKIELIKGAIDILTRYKQTTYPELLRMSGLQAVEDVKANLTRELGREPTTQEVAAKLGMSEFEFTNWAASQRRFRIAGESVEGAEEKIATLRRLERELQGLLDDK